MFKGFDIKCNLPERFYDLYEGYFDRHLSNNSFSESAVVRAMRAIINKDTPINSDILSKTLFPQVDCEIFISHSRDDKRIAKAISGYLHKNLGLRCFIDAFVWGNIKTIQREIDEECKNDDGTWDYNQRNKSTSHVHMMLSMSLLEMMDRCECIFLLDTPNSITAKSSIAGTTHSPWIFMEMFSSKFLRITKPQRSGALQEAVANANVLRKDSAKAVEIVHRVDLSHLEKINASYICNWVDYCNRHGIDGPESLDELYLENMLPRSLRSPFVIYS